MPVIELKGGLLVQSDVLAVALELERDGHVLSVVDGRLLVSNGRGLSLARQEQIRVLKPHLMALATYHAPEPGEDD